MLIEYNKEMVHIEHIKIFIPISPFLCYAQMGVSLKMDWIIIVTL